MINCTHGHIYVYNAEEFIVVMHDTLSSMPGEITDHESTIIICIYLRVKFIKKFDGGQQRYM